ncbi:glutamate-rich protein 3-like isoform X2 [Acropora muricata]|uniref:glutamate-rich protein 3-like isoform X2 n=1 Tax=Acropora muricata TaxID=159855 RepID=UPI0034E39A57
MSHADSGPLASYNSLQDKHLAGYFSNSRMKRHLRKSGLVTKRGTIIDEKTYRLNMAKKEHRKHVRDLLATAIVHKTLDIERVRQYEIRKRLDEAYKVELVRRVKEARTRKGDEDILPLLSPRERTAHMRKVHKGKSERPSTAPAAVLDDSSELDGPLRPSEIYYDDDSKKIYYKVASSSSPVQMDEAEELGPSPYVRAYPSTYPGPAPPPTGTPRRRRAASVPRRGIKLQRYHYLARTEPAVARRVQLQSMAEVTMKFLGPSLVLTNSIFPEDRLSEVMVLQQHCGGSTLCVFRELLPPNTIFTFISRRHRGAPFGLTFYIDGMQDIRLSSCCEYKHKPGKILGGRNGHFQFVLVEGAAPCYRCQVASGVRSKRRSSQGDEDSERLKTFLTEPGDDQDHEEDEEGEVFDVIITKIKPPEDESKGRGFDESEMVDNSTQTPREDDNPTQEEEVKVQVEENNTVEEDNKGDQEDEREDSGADEYDNDDSEESPENEDGENEGKEKIDKENEDANEEYNEDFESDDEKEKEKSDDEKSDIGSDEESDKKSNEDSEADDESDKKSDKHSDSEADNGSDKESIKSADEDSVPRSEKEADKAESHKDDDEDGEIQDETEEKSKSLVEESGKQEEADEVEDEVEETKEEDADRPVSAASSEGKQSKNVSFDDDVTVFDSDQQDDKLNEPGDMKQDEDIPEDSKLGDENEGDDKHKDGKEADRPVSSPKPSHSSSESSSSGSSGESSDNEGNDDRKSKRKKKTKGRPGDDPGSDPDLVSSGQLPEQALKAVGVTPGTKHEGSVQVLLEGKEDVDIAGVELTTDQFEEVARIIDSKEELGSIILRNAAADDNTLEILAEPLKRCHDLKMLNLSINRIGPAGAKLLAAVIKENKSLRMLLLHGNPLTDEGVEILVDAVVKTSNISLMNLDLGDCGLTVEGAKHVARLIESNNTITILTVSGNIFGLEGWKAISNALKTNSTLETLSLDFSKIGDEEAVLIAEGLQECKNLRSIDLEGNRIGDEGGRRLFKAVKMNKSIVDLTLFPMNKISKEIVVDVKELLELRARGIEPEESEIGEDNTDKLQGDQNTEEQLHDDQNKSEPMVDVKETMESEEQERVTSDDVPAEKSREEGEGEAEEDQGTEKDPPEKMSGDASGDAEGTKDGSEELEGENQREEEVAATAEEGAGNALDEQQLEKGEVISAETDGEGNNGEQGSLDEGGPSTNGEVSQPEEAATAEDPQNENERENETKGDEGTEDVVPPQNEEPNEKPSEDSFTEEPSEKIASEEGPTSHGPSGDELSEQEPPVKGEIKEEKELDEVSPDQKVLEEEGKGTVEDS